jgi:hypothetical protein
MVSCAGKVWTKPKKKKTIRSFCMDQHICMKK